jgi:hypothetical protein
MEELELLEKQQAQYIQSLEELVKIRFAKEIICNVF